VTAQTSTQPMLAEIDARGASRRSPRPQLDRCTLCCEGREVKALAKPREQMVRALHDRLGAASTSPARTTVPPHVRGRSPLPLPPTVLFRADLVIEQPSVTNGQFLAPRGPSETAAGCRRLSRNRTGPPQSRIGEVDPLCLPMRSALLRASSHVISFDTAK
jgi:hypothetical protein